MRWTGDRGHIEDMRGRSGFGAGRGLPLGIGGLVVLLLLSWLTGADFLSLLSGGGAPSGSETAGTSGPLTSTPEEERLVDMVGAVMKDAQETWTTLLPDRYQETSAVLFRDAYQSACGFAQAATGPFYCPGDRKVYLDLSFFDELDRRFGAPGDFAQAYVIAHELGHHVQTVTGIEGQMRQQQQRRPSQANELSVRLELQADCFAGVWGHAASRPGRFMQNRVELESGDVEEGLQAAAAIGDDRLQKMSGGRVAPESFTHGSSAQRVEWFRRGLEHGDPEACNTFGT
ncbi:MAG: KPN_02809 family neutral zinc metallopeptidase [Vicinamibacterales bacterium]